MKEMITFFKENGYYCGRDKFDHQIIEAIKTEFDDIFAEKQRRFFDKLQGKDYYAANHDINRWNMLLPSDSEAIKSSFFARKEIFGLLKSLFQSPFALVFFSSDISSPGSEFQTIHQDGNDFAIALNVPLVNSDENNGATHIYPGTHKPSPNHAFSLDSNSFLDEEIIERAKQLKPLSLNVKIGDYTLRDLRLIHRGAPNKTKFHRPYLSSIYLPSTENTAPTFDAINYGLSTFKYFKDKAFPTGREELIDYANTFGRTVMLHSFSDRVARPIPKDISRLMSEEALYCMRFAKFEDDKLNNRITRTKFTSKELLEDVEIAKSEFEKMFKN
jgi:ectoine hydroxylase-related dioxygenase (phytanoyl-CoA dioxygenase family)